MAKEIVERDTGIFRRVVCLVETREQLRAWMRKFARSLNADDRFAEIAELLASKMEPFLVADQGTPPDPFGKLRRDAPPSINDARDAKVQLSVLRKCLAILRPTTKGQTLDRAIVGALDLGFLLCQIQVGCFEPTVAGRKAGGPARKKRADDAKEAFCIEFKKERERDPIAEDQTIFDRLIDRFRVPGLPNGLKMPTERNARIVLVEEGIAVVKVRRKRTSKR